jgi:hypothetical protein
MGLLKMDWKDTLMQMDHHRSINMRSQGMSFLLMEEPSLGPQRNKS